VLQGRLAEDSSPLALGLLVMRRAGLRIGELRRLERQCVVKDHVGGRFLKVPLGKLDNERLVPLDPKTLEVVEQLQTLGRDNERWLIEGARTRPTSALTFGRTLARLGAGLPLAEPLTSHRLRHTFASSLMNGGMSRLGIMKLLGHRDQRMTLRYTQQSQTPRSVASTSKRSAASATATSFPAVDGQPDTEPDPVVLIQDVVRWLAKFLFGTAFDRPARLLARRLEAVRDELEELVLHLESQGR
jgi:hypothetical protein